MGGRGGSSHRGGGDGFGRGHLAEWTDNESALRQIMRDTGLPEAAARQVQQDMIRYFGADYGSFTNGSLPVETQRITDALLKMPYYNAGPIYRGIHVPNAVADRFCKTIRREPGTASASCSRSPAGRTLPRALACGTPCTATRRASSLSCRAIKLRPARCTFPTLDIRNRKCFRRTSRNLRCCGPRWKPAHRGTGGSHFIWRTGRGGKDGNQNERSNPGLPDAVGERI